MRDYIFQKKKNTKKAVFLDRDGTINIDVVMGHKESDLKLFDDCIEAMTILASLNVYLFIITNQTGIALGRYDVSEMAGFNRLIVNILKENGIIINGVYYCPHYDYTHSPKGYLGCECSKPKPGLLYEAANDFDIDFKQSIIIGDQPSDIGAGISAGIENTIMVTTGLYEYGDYTLAKNANKYRPKYVVSNLLHAANIVKQILHS